MSISLKKHPRTSTQSSAPKNDFFKKMYRVISNHDYYLENSANTISNPNFGNPLITNKGKNKSHYPSSDSLSHSSFSHTSVSTRKKIRKPNFTTIGPNSAMNFKKRYPLHYEHLPTGIAINSFQDPLVVDSLVSNEEIMVKGLEKEQRVIQQEKEKVYQQLSDLTQHVKSRIERAQEESIQ